MTKTERTDILLKKFRGLNDEFSMLKGILCMSHGYCEGNISYEQYDKEAAERKKIESIFDTKRIAARMDELNGTDVAA